MKKILYIVSFMIIMFIGMNNVKASSATCTYKYKFATITVQYEYGQQITNSTTYENSNKKYEIKTVDIKATDIVGSDGKISCPNLTVKQQADSNKKYKVSLFASSDGTVSGTLNITNDDGKEKNKPLSGNHSCINNAGKDDEYKLTWNGSGVTVTLTGSKIKNYDYTILKDFSAEDFANNNCPTSYILCQNKQRINKCTISSEHQSLFQEDNDSQVENVDTGEIIVNEDKEKPSTNVTPTSGATAKLVKEIYGIAKIVVPVLIVILSIIDFLKVVLLSDEKDYKNAWNKLIKRVIVGIIFFVVPALVSLIINISGIDTTQNFLGIFE